MSFTTWIRVEDDFGQFDHPKDAELPKGVKPVKNYPEHLGPWARPSKSRTDKTGAPAGRITEPEPVTPVADPDPTPDPKPAAK